jgi:hypothetical protein
MHLGWHDYAVVVEQRMGKFRRFVQYPHLLVCAGCRGELAEFEKNRTFLADVKDAYAKTEADYFEMRSKRDRR